MRFKIKLTTILPKLTIHPTILIVGAMVAANGSTYGQGTVDFNTFVLGTGALVYDAAAFGGEPLGSAYVGDGTNFFAQLYAAARTGAATSSLVAVGVPVNFRGGVSGGWVQTSGTTSLGFALTPSPPGPGTVVTIPFLTLGGPATVQMRAWWGGGNVITSYEDAVVSSNPNSRWGASLPIDLAATGSPGGLTPVSLTGLQGFELIPEPSTLVLAGMGAAALLFFRRRK